MLSNCLILCCPFSFCSNVWEQSDTESSWGFCYHHLTFIAFLNVKPPAARILVICLTHLTLKLTKVPREKPRMCLWNRLVSVSAGFPTDPCWTEVFRRGNEELSSSCSFGSAPSFHLLGPPLRDGLIVGAARIHKRWHERGSWWQSLGPRLVPHPVWALLHH